MEFSQFNENLVKSIDRLPLTEDMIPLYLNILATTDNAVIRGTFSYKLSEMYPQNAELKKVLIELINSPKTNGAKGNLLYSLMSMDYSDPECIDAICVQLVEGNYECMHKAFHMLMDITDKIDEESKARILKYLDKHGEILGERLDLIEELYNYINSFVNTVDSSTKTADNSMIDEF